MRASESSRVRLNDPRCGECVSFAPGWNGCISELSDRYATFAYSQCCNFFRRNRSTEKEPSWLTSLRIR